ncbi:tumor necrosis factor receptor superfamily member 5-like isoform X2 [Salminus brasiliensis]|uniref:tumor necrosis factor receptor superfamily member 5-like isoform X2 n=1 Tax=Salminus brasiliensis TaxID=930266 RepID=UPI003B833BB6
MKSTFLIHNVYLYGVLLLTDGCDPSKKQSVCPRGTIISEDCTCRSCTKGTFMDSEPNGFKMCFQCKICTKGLNVSHPCTSISNTVCEIRNGYHCIKYNGSECIAAMEHRHCDPGEEIKVPGTKTSDTVCEACQSGYYSPLGINCIKWTDCSVRNQVQDKEGSSVQDVQCKSKPRERNGLIACTVLSLVLLIVSYVKHRRQVRGGNRADHALKDPVQESGQ